jgi:uncharacterized protein YicC (UPF0701 family)
MTITSMTGFGRARAEADGRTVEVQIASVNNKGIQVAVRGDLRDLALDEDLRRRCRERLGRGSVTVQVAVSMAGAPIDRARLAAAWRDLKSLADELGAPAPTLEQVAHLLPGGRETDAGSPAALALTACAAALDALVAARAREGAALAAVFRELAAKLRALLPRLGEAAAVRLPKARAALVQRIAEAYAQAALPAPDPALLVREVALIAERIDVAEELARLASHCDALDAVLAAGGEIGRRLEFLAQEFGRELTTTAAKANDPALTVLTVDGRLLVDQLKEQAANVV